METLDKLISNEEMKIEHLIQKRVESNIPFNSPGSDNYNCRTDDLDYDIERAYEQLAIYKIRKMMGF